MAAAKAGKPHAIAALKELKVIIQNPGKALKRYEKLVK